jgi:hypothetical protein
MTHSDRPFTDFELDLLDGEDGLLDERIEGLEAIKNIINPRMSMPTFYARHRADIDYILFVDKDHIRHGKTARFFTFRRLVYHYMLKRRVV